MLTERLTRYRSEQEELWTALEAVTTERDQLLRRLSGVVEHVPDVPPPPGALQRRAGAGTWERLGRSSTSV